MNGELPFLYFLTVFCDCFALYRTKCLYGDYCSTVCKITPPPSAGGGTVLQHYQDALEGMFNQSRMGTQTTLDTITAEMSLIIRRLSNEGIKGTRPNNHKQRPLTGRCTRLQNMLLLLLRLLALCPPPGSQKGKKTRHKPPHHHRYSHRTSCHILYGDKCCA